MYGHASGQPRNQRSTRTSPCAALFDRSYEHEASTRPARPGTCLLLDQGSHAAKLREHAKRRHPVPQRLGIRSRQVLDLRGLLEWRNPGLGEYNLNTRRRGPAVRTTQIAMTIQERIEMNPEV